MRLRRVAPLSAVALAALVLAGCAGSGSPDASPSGSSSSSDLCASAAAPGSASDGVTVEGEVGSEPTATFSAPLEISTLERSVDVEGDGTAIAEGDYVTYALTVFDASTGEQLDSAGYGDQTLPAITVTVGSGPDQFLGCATAGSRIVSAVPSSDGTSAAQVWVLDVLDVVPADAWCAVDSGTEGMPSVEFDADGVPTITIPDSDPLDTVHVNVLTEGDGAVVGQGDSVTVDYTGVKWSDGSVFDSSWERGEPATFTTTGVVTGFQRALEGQKVGSTVLVSMPPACGYGEAGSSSHELAGETLVFVVEIVSSEPAQ